MSREKIHVIGVGSPFGADRIGWLAAEWLQLKQLHRQFPQLDLDYLLCDRPGALLLDQLRECDGAIIIDAMQAGLPQATVRQFAVEQLCNESGLLSTHGFGVVEALMLGRTLADRTGDEGILPRHLTIIGIEMGDAIPSEQWQEQLDVLMRKILSEWLA